MQNPSYRFDRRRLPWLISLIALSALILGACNAVQIPQTGDQPGEVAVEITDSAVTAAGPVRPGITTIAVNNTGASPRMLMLARLNSDVTLDQFTETFATDDMAAVNLVSLSGGRYSAAGETTRFAAELKEGTYAVIGFPEEEGTPLIGSFEVSGSPTGAPAPQANRTVDMVDFAFVLPGEVTAGEQTWEIKNSGAQWHEIVIVKPAEGMTQEKLIELFRQDQPPEGPAPFEDVASFGPVSQGERGWMTFDLPT